MATVDGLTKARMLAIEAESITAARIDALTSHLILTTHGGTDIDVGNVTGPVGPVGPAGPVGPSLNYFTKSITANVPVNAGSGVELCSQLLVAGKWFVVGNICLFVPASEAGAAGTAVGDDWGGYGWLQTGASQGIGAFGVGGTGRDCVSFANNSAAVTALNIPVFGVADLAVDTIVSLWVAAPVDGSSIYCNAEGAYGYANATGFTGIKIG